MLAFGGVGGACGCAAGRGLPRPVRGARRCGVRPRGGVPCGCVRRRRRCRTRDPACRRGGRRGVHHPAPGGMGRTHALGGRGGIRTTGGRPGRGGGIVQGSSVVVRCRSMPGRCTGGRCDRADGRGAVVSGVVIAGRAGRGGLFIQAPRLALGPFVALVAVVAVVGGIDRLGRRCCGRPGGSAPGGCAVEHRGAHGVGADLAREAELVAHGRGGGGVVVIVVVGGVPARDGGARRGFRIPGDGLLRLCGVRLLVDVGGGGGRAGVPEDVVGEGVVVGVVVLDQQRVQQVRGGCIGGDQVGGVLGLTHVQDLEAAVPGAGGQGTRVVHEQRLVSRGGHQD